MEEKSGRYLFIYDDDYSSEPVSLTMPSSHKKYSFLVSASELRQEAANRDAKLSIPGL